MIIMGKVQKVITIVLIGFIVFFVLLLFVIGWWQGFYKPLLIACIFLILLLAALLLYTNGLQNEIEEYKNKRKYYKFKIEQLESENEGLKRKLSCVKPESFSQQSNSDPSQTVSQQEQKKEAASDRELQSQVGAKTTVNVIKDFEEEYYSSPNANGEFDRSHAKKTRTDDCFYKIVWKSSETKGELELLEKKDYSRLLAYRTDCLYPVCDVVSNKSNGQIITMVLKGYVRMRENKWLVESEDKIKIRIE